MNIFGRKKHAHIGKIYEHFETNYENKLQTYCIHINILFVIVKRGLH